MSRTVGIFTALSERNCEGTLCRLCMKNNNNYYNVFTSNIAFQITVKDALSDLLGLQVAVGDGLPTTMCPLCLKKLKEFRVFKVTCLESDARLKKFSGIDCLRSIQGDEAVDDKLGSSADTKDCIQDEIQGTSHLTCSVQTTEIYIPVPDSHQSRANMLVTVEDENKDPLREDNYHVMYTPDPAEISSNDLDPLATDELSGMATCGSPCLKADQTSDDGGGCVHSDSTDGATNVLQPQASAQETLKEENKDPLSEDNYPEVYVQDPAKISSNDLDPLATDDLAQASTSSQGEAVDAEGKRAIVIDLDTLLVLSKNELSPKETDAIEPTDTENGEVVQNLTMAVESMTEAVESPAHERASTLSAVLEPKTRASYSRKGKKLMDKDIKKCDTLLADKIPSCSIPNDGRLHSKSKYASKISGDRATMTIAGKRGGCDNADTIKFIMRSTENGKNGPDTVIQENKVKSTCMIKNPGKFAGSRKKYYHCSKCRDAFNDKYDLMKHLEIHFGSGNLNIDSNLSMEKIRPSNLFFSRKETKSSCQPIPSKSLPQLMCKTQGLKQKENRILKDNFGGTRENKSVREVRRNSIVDVKSCTVSPHTAKKSYSCSECEKSFSKKSNLICHIRTHTKEKPYSCNECEKSFSARNSLYRHLRIHTKEKPYSCNQCDKSFSQKSNLVSHILTHSKEKAYSCGECEKSFSRKDYLVSHIWTHRKEKPYSCYECDKSFTHKNALVIHIRTHTKEKPYSCNECDKSFSERGSLVRHIRTHTKEKPYNCGECEKSFSRKHHLVYHMRTHTKEKPYSCNVCDKNFSLKNTLVLHTRTHTKEKPYSCYECDKSFSLKSILAIHIRTHTKVRPYSCSVCKKSFSQNSHLVYHMRTHTKEKPYSCNVCDKNFSLKNILVHHIRTHTKEKPYSCDECEKSFSRKDRLVSHMRTHTKEKPHSCNKCDKSFTKKTTLVSHMRTHSKEKPC